MQRLGTVLHISPNHNIVVKTEKLQKIGQKVIDENLKPIGEVFDIIGPVSSPYTLVRPTIREPEKLLNKTLYAFPSERRKEKNTK